MIPHTAFYFIRHGETDWNRQNIFMGRQDIPLNQTGHEQAHVAAGQLIDAKIEHIVASPLSRALGTAQIIAAKLKKPLTIIDELKEVCGGSQEGLPVDANKIQEWSQGKTPEGAETPEEIGARTVMAMNKALQVPGPVLVVGHRAIYCAIQKILNIPLTEEIKNCVPIFHCPPKHPTHPWFVCGVGEEE